ncbi:peptidoglycan-recognition protein SC2-like [Protopterus annectens]|uniref:peptidoglycan-recognition protein SC2-like n=1 Tax=Protopterus annectens TaxID=7888 RepID=UPI001CFB05CE|nr:peptidoglycan-recognition protein SC2-like [Protopterus annectens]
MANEKKLFLNLVVLQHMHRNRLPDVELQSCPTIRSCSEWGAHRPRCTNHLSTPVTYAVIHHTAGSPCSTRSSCISEVKSIPNYHMDHNGWCDIGYSFLTGGDGHIYEGVGWDRRGAHAKNYNRVSYGISFIGNFMKTTPTTSAQNAAKSLIACAWSKNKLKSNYILKGHRQLGSTIHYMGSSKNGLTIN